jgi:hypothetical protein
MKETLPSNSEGPDNKPPKVPTSKKAGKKILYKQERQTKDIEYVLKSALSDYICAQSDLRKYSRRNGHALVSVVQEFLNSFILLGYTPDGEPVEIVYSHTAQEAGALTALINKFFDRIHGDIED